MNPSRKRLLLTSALLALILVLAMAGQTGIAQDEEPEPTAEATPAEEPTAESAEEPAEGPADEPAEEPAEEPTEEPAAEPTPVPADVSGAYRIGGASSVYNITNAIVTRFGQDYSDIEITVSAEGTAGGFDEFCSGNAYINNAARPILDSEAARCADSGIEWVELLVAYEGVVLATHPETAGYAACLTVEQLDTIWSAASEPYPEVDAEDAEAAGAELPEARPGVTDWSQVDPDFPEGELLLFGDNVSSAPADMLSSAATGTAGYIRGDYTANTRYQALVDEMVGKPGSLGFFSFDYFNLNEEELELVGIDSGGGCAHPTEEAIFAGEYPLAQPMYLYVDATQLENPAVRAFVEFYLSDVAREVIAEQGYIPAPAETFARDLELVENVTTGRVFTEAPPEPEPVVVEGADKGDDDAAGADTNEDTGETTDD
jgi:phosphate transport system substrate-binding protein